MGEGMQDRIAAIDRTGFNDERHPAGRYWYNTMCMSATQKNVVSSIQVDWNGIVPMFTYICAAFLHARSNGVLRYEYHIAKIISVYRSYQLLNPGTYGSSVDRLNIILNYLSWHAAPDWYRVEMKGMKDYQYLPGDILISLNPDEAWGRTELDDFQKVLDGHEVGYGASVEVDEDDREHFMNLILPERWQRYRLNFAEEKPTEEIRAAFKRAKLEIPDFV